MPLEALFDHLLSTRDERTWLRLFENSRRSGQFVTGTELCDYALHAGIIRGDEATGESEIADAITLLCNLWDEWTSLADAHGQVPGSG